MLTAPAPGHCTSATGFAFDRARHIGEMVAITAFGLSEALQEYRNAGCNATRMQGASW